MRALCNGASPLATYEQKEPVGLKKHLIFLDIYLLQHVGTYCKLLVHTVVMYVKTPVTSCDQVLNAFVEKGSPPNFSASPAQRLTFLGHSSESGRQKNSSVRQTIDKHLVRGRDCMENTPKISRFKCSSNARVQAAA